jgi:type II secretory pathway predicted ATPase ExeA
MYRTFFGLPEYPFQIAPDPRFFFFSHAHKEALGYLLHGIEERQGVIALTGEVGTGKTLLCRALLDRLGRNVRTALIFNSLMSELDLLRSITEDFGLAPAGASRHALIAQLNAYLLQAFHAGHTAVLIIDEAQNLASPVLEQLRMLSNLETARDKLLQIVLIGQPELRQRLAHPELRQLNQRIAVRYHLRPFTRQETADYVWHRLMVAGARGGVPFSRGAFSATFQLSHGIARKINLLCDRALLAAYVHGSRRIEAKHLRQAWGELEGPDGGGGVPRAGATSRRTGLWARPRGGNDLWPWRQAGARGRQAPSPVPKRPEAGRLQAFTTVPTRPPHATRPQRPTWWAGSAWRWTRRASGAGRRLGAGLLTRWGGGLGWRRALASAGSGQGLIVTVLGVAGLFMVLSGLPQRSPGERPPRRGSGPPLQASYQAPAGEPFVFPLPLLAHTPGGRPVDLTLEASGDEPPWLQLDRERLAIGGTAPLAAEDRTYRLMIRAPAEPGGDSRWLVSLTIIGQPERRPVTPPLPGHWTW